MTRTQDKATAEWMKNRTAKFLRTRYGRSESLERGDLVACTGSGSNLPQTAQLPAYQAMTLGIVKAEDGKPAPQERR